MGKLADLIIQITVGKYAMMFFGIVGLPDDCGCVAKFVKVAVEAVLCNVEPGSLEPFY